MSIPFMPIYWGDYHGDTQHLTAIEHGGYLLLISHYWRTGSIPSDPLKLSRISRMTTKQWSTHGPTILEFFKDGRHKRIDKELSLVATKSQKMRLAAEKRWNTTDTVKPLETLDEQDANALPEQSKSNANQNHNQNQNHTVRKKDIALATRLPDDWQPSDSDIDFAISLDVDYRREADIFRDYWIAQAGAKGRKANWQSTWRNWIRRASERIATQPSRKETAIEMGKRLIRENGYEQSTGNTINHDHVVSLPRQQSGS